jgi:REP element-mobilizing transposase RayT
VESMRGHHNVGEANLHLQFTPKYRRDVFRDEVVQVVCEASFREIAEQLGLVLHALAFGPDLVHVFVGACKNHSVAKVVRRLKSASSRRIRRLCWARVKGRLWGTAFWSGGYFCRSVVSTIGEAIKYYI